MRNRTVNVTIGLCFLAASAVAQHGGGRAAMISSGVHGTAPSGSQHARPPSLGSGSGKTAYAHARYPRTWHQPLSPTDYLGGAPGYASADRAEASDAAAPTVFWVMQPVAVPPPESLPAPARPVRPEIREYSWGASSTGPSSVYAIVLKDGSVRLAIALCRQGSRLTYLAPGQSGGEVEFSDVDREATRQANSTDLLQ